MARSLLERVPNFLTLLQEVFQDKKTWMPLIPWLLVLSVLSGIMLPLLEHLEVITITVTDTADFGVIIFEVGILLISYTLMYIVIGAFLTGHYVSLLHNRTSKSKKNKAMSWAEKGVLGIQFMIISFATFLLFVIPIVIISLILAILILIGWIPLILFWIFIGVFFTLLLIYFARNLNLTEGFAYQQAFGDMKKNYAPLLIYALMYIAAGIIVSIIIGIIFTIPSLAIQISKIDATGYILLSIYILQSFVASVVSSIIAIAGMFGVVQIIE